MTNLTPLERSVLSLLQEQSSANGHDFGVLESVEWPDRKQLGGVVTSLQNKGIIVELERCTVNDDENLTQYVLAAEHREG